MYFYLGVPALDPVPLPSLCLEWQKKYSQNRLKRICKFTLTTKEDVEILPFMGKVANKYLDIMQKGMGSVLREQLYKELQGRFAGIKMTSHCQTEFFLS